MIGFAELAFPSASKPLQTCSRLSSGGSPRLVYEHKAFWFQINPAIGSAPDGRHLVFRSFHGPSRQGISVWLTISRSTFFWILPVTVMGKLSTNTTRSGTL